MITITIAFGQQYTYYSDDVWFACWWFVQKLLYSSNNQESVPNEKSDLLHNEISLNNKLVTL
jgi:hypothetical protein